MSMQTHYVQRLISTNPEVTAFLAMDPVDKALVFLHGFNGSAVGTWLQFPRLLLETEAFAGYDLYFFGYDGLRTRSYISSLKLRDFLRRLLPSPCATLDPHFTESEKRSEGSEYGRLFIVAHSLGAVVARQALVEAWTSKETWLDLVRLILFAPAHLGANIAKLCLEAFTGLPFRGIPEALVSFAFPPIQDLKHDSETLAKLLADTRSALESGASDCFKARRVILAETDRIVEPGRFAEDPAAELITGVGHSGICKPRQDFREPLGHLLSAL